MEKLITGIHHITALADDPQKNIDFYAGVLGLRMVKKTVNFDAPEVYHLYYGNKTGDPGTLLTFFPYSGIQRGRRGNRMMNTTGFSVPAYSLGYWQQRLKRFKIDFSAPLERFQNETVIYFEDHDGTGIELVFNEKDPRPAFTYGTIPIENAIKGFYNAEIWLDELQPTVDLLTNEMGHVLTAESGNRFRFAPSDAPGNYIDLVHSPGLQKGLSGAGSIHHIAFNTANRESQEQVRIKIARCMLNPTHIIDRNYFTSVYFREPGGVLFEIATAGPGMDIDEPVEHLGETFRLPQQYEPYRDEIEKLVKPVRLQLNNYQ